MTSSKLKIILVQEAEEIDNVYIEFYPALITEQDLTDLVGIKWVLTYVL